MNDTEGSSSHEAACGPKPRRHHSRVTRGAALVAVSLSLSAALIASHFWPAEDVPDGRPAEPTALETLLSQAGFMVLKPPSRLHGPGTLNTVESGTDDGLGTGFVHLHPTCKLKDVQSLVPVESPTADRIITQLKSRSFDASAKLMDQIEVAGLGEKVKSVKMSLTNSRILLLSHEELLGLQLELIQGSCEQAIKYNLEAGSRVCQTESVLQTDVVYTIEYRDEVSAGKRAELTKEIAEQVKLSRERAGENRIAGQRLYYGVRLMPRCIELADVGQQIASNAH